MKNQLIRVLTIIGLCMAVPLTGLPAAPDPGLSTTEFTEPEHATTDRLIFAYHYPWYGYKQPWQWDKQTTILDHPLLGPYRSDDPKLIDFQVCLACDAGIDGFIVSWSGPETTPGKIFQQMLDQIGAHSPRQFRLCVVLEHLANFPGLSNEKLRLALAYVLKEFGKHPGYLRVDGKPVIFVYQAHTLPLDRWRPLLEGLTTDYGPAWYVAVPDGWDIDLEYLSVFDSIVPYADKYYSDEVLTNSYKQVAKHLQTLGKPSILAAIGGGSRIRKLGFDIERSKGQYLRRRFALAQQVAARWITITSWNEWYEAMQIEPSCEYGFEQVRYVRELAAAFKGKALPLLDGACLSVKQNRSGAATELWVKNTGKCNIYCVAAMGSKGPRQIIAYVLHPGEDTQVQFEGTCEQVVGCLPDDTVVGVRPRL